jgi:3-oxoacyl-[acyl-carrier protein] reductase
LDLGIAGKRAAVAASSQGLGFAVAEALAAEGVTVALGSRRREAVEAAAERIGSAAVPLVADVSTADGATAFVRDARIALGGIDILVGNAGGPPAGNFATASVDQYTSAFELNCLSTIAMCYEAVPEMRERKWGRVVAITSIAVRQPIAHLILSNTARAGLTGFLKTLATEVAGDGVTVNSLLPGLHETARITDLYDVDARAELAKSVPTGSIGRPDDFGRAAAFLCSEHARYITGTATPIDGGANAGLL